MAGCGWLWGSGRRRIAVATIPLLVGAGTVLAAAPAQAQTVTVTVVDQFGAPSSDVVRGVTAADKFGDVYIGGSTNGAFSGFTSAGGADGFVRAYSSSGKVRWTRQFGTPSDDNVTGVAADGSGTVYAVGYTSGGVGFIRAYSRSGKLSWTRQIAASSTVFVSGVAVDRASNVDVAGYFSGPDGFVRSYTAGGTERWTSQFSATDGAWVNAIAVDGSGNVYVGGYTLGAFSGFTNLGYQDAFVRSYTPDGTERWTSQFGTSYDDAAKAVAVDGSGNLYVGGYTSGTFGGGSHAAAGTDSFVRSYTTDGTERWTSQFGTSFASSGVNGVAVDGSGNVYVGGFTYGAFSGFTNAGNIDGFMRSYTAGGTERWTSQFGTSGNDEVDGVAVDGSGKVYLAGTTDGALSGFTNTGGTDGFLANIVQGA